MAARLSPLIAWTASVLSTSSLDAGAESALALERVSSGVPFSAGDQLLLDFQGDGAPDLKVFTILQTACWPWVLARCEKGGAPYDVWINFSLVRSARRVAAK